MSADHPVTDTEMNGIAKNFRWNVWMGILAAASLIISGFWSLHTELSNVTISMVRLEEQFKSMNYKVTDTLASSHTKEEAKSDQRITDIYLMSLKSRVDKLERIHNPCKGD